MCLYPIADISTEEEPDTTPTSQSDDIPGTEADHSTATTEADEGTTVVTTQANIAPTGMSTEESEAVPEIPDGDFSRWNDSSSTTEPDSGSGLPLDTIKSTVEAPHTAPRPTKSE